MKIELNLTDQQLATVVYFFEKPHHVSAQIKMAPLLQDVGLYEKAIGKLYPGEGEVREKAQGA